MITKFELFESDKDDKRYIVCIKDFYAYVSLRDLVANGMSKKEASEISSYLLFKKGEKYLFTGPTMTSADGVYLYIINSKLKRSHKAKYITRGFYENDYGDENSIEKWFELPEDLKKEQGKRQKRIEFNL